MSEEGAGEAAAEAASGCSLLLRGLFGLGWTVLLFVAAVGTKVSLVFHELMHALVQLCMGARPRIVLTTGGGYAQPLPWFNSPVAVIPLALGSALLGGVASLAPLLGGSFAIYLAIHFLAPLEPNTLVTLADALTAASASGGVGGVAAALNDAGATLIRAVAGAGALRITGILLVALLLSNSLTPSSVDFWAGRYDFLAYVLAWLVATAAFLHAPIPGWLLLGVWLPGLIVGGKLKGGEDGPAREWPAAITTCGMTLSLFGLLGLVGVLGESPVAGLHRILAVVAILFVLAAITYGVFLTGLTALALLSLRVGVLRKMIKHVPAELRGIFTLKAVCSDCRVFFEPAGSCDGCQRTQAEIVAATRAETDEILSGGD